MLGMVQLERIGMMSTNKENELLARFNSLSEEISKKEEELIKLNAELLAMSRAKMFREDVLNKLNKE